jgi:HD-like signal output (HDOD) protein
MPTRTEDTAAIVQSTVQGISHIATLPEITLKIIELVEKPTSTAQDLHAVIANDPALCSRILKVVNSAFYGLPRQIGSINRAIVLLGLNAVKNIAIAASLAKLFRGGEICKNFAARDLWTHSIATATAARMIADKIRMGLPDEAFLAGLIHDIGILVELQADRHKLIEVFNKLNIDAHGVPGASMLDVERDVFGADHEDFGSGLCEMWKFPKSFGAVAGHHHDPTELPEPNRPLAWVVNVADRLTAQHPKAFRADLRDTAVNPAAMAALGMSEEQLADIVARLPQAIEEVETTLNMAA